MTVGNTDPEGRSGNLLHALRSSASKLQNIDTSRNAFAHVTSRYGAGVFACPPSASARFWGGIMVHLDERSPGA